MKTIFYLLSKFTRKQFTLIELLVVIAVIAILAALLQPVLGKAKAKSKQIYCVGNQKQIGSASQNYASDYNGWLCTMAAGGTQPWYYVWNSYLGPSLSWADCFNADKRTVTWCPSLEPFASNYTDAYGCEYWSTLIALYSDGRYYLTKPGATFIRLPYLPDPSNHPYVADSMLSLSLSFGVLRQWNVFDKINGNYSAMGANVSGINMRHTGLANVLFADGHVESAGKSRLKECGADYIFTQTGTQEGL